MDYNKVAKEVISHVGGPKNIKKSISLCYTFKIDVEGSIIGR